MRREVLEEISLCGSDFWHFATSWVKIIDRDTMRLVTIKPNFAQEKFIETTKEASKTYLPQTRKAVSNTPPTLPSTPTAFRP